MFGMPPARIIAGFESLPTYKLLSMNHHPPYRPKISRFPRSTLPPWHIGQEYLRPSNATSRFVGFIVLAP